MIFELAFKEVLIYVLKLIKKYGKLLLVDVLIEIKDKIKLIKIIIKQNSKKFKIQNYVF